MLKVCRNARKTLVFLYTCEKFKNFRLCEKIWFGWFWLIFSTKTHGKTMKKNPEKHKKGKKSTKITDFGWFFQPKSSKIRKKAKNHEKKIWLILVDFFSTKIMENNEKKNWKNTKKAKNQPKSQILVDFFNQNPVKLEKRQKSWKNPPKSVILVDFNQPKSINK